MNGLQCLVTAYASEHDADPETIPGSGNPLASVANMRTIGAVALDAVIHHVQAVLGVDLDLRKVINAEPPTGFLDAVLILHEDDNFGYVVYDGFDLNPDFFSRNRAPVVGAWVETVSRIVQANVLRARRHRPLSEQRDDLLASLREAVRVIEGAAMSVQKDSGLGVHYTTHAQKARAVVDRVAMSIAREGKAARKARGSQSQRPSVVAEA